MIYKLQKCLAKPDRNAQPIVEPSDVLLATFDYYVA